MKFFQAFLPLLAGLALGAHATKHHEHHHPLPCVTEGAHIVSIRGEGETPDGHGYGLVISLVEAIKAVIPHSTSVAVSYNEKPDTRDSNTDAVEHLKYHIKSYAKRCPNSKMIVTGYSEGGGVTMNTICGTLNPGWNYTSPLSTQYKKNIAAIIVYGDYTHAVGQPYNRGSCHHDSPWPRLHNQNCRKWTKQLHSYCHKRDPACCSGHDQDAHWSYFRVNDKEAAHWAMERFHEAKRHDKRSEHFDNVTDDMMLQI